MAMNSMIAGSMLPERVPITTPSSGSKTHGSIDTFAVYNSADGGTIAQMADDNFGVVFVKSQELNGTFGNEAVGGSVETVSSYFVFLVVIQRQTVRGKLSAAWSDGKRYRKQLPAERRASARSRH